MLFGWLRRWRICPNGMACQHARNALIGIHTTRLTMAKAHRASEFIAAFREQGEHLKALDTALNPKKKDARE